MRLKNKSSIALIVIGALVMALAIALAACNAHQHAFSDEWSFDDSGHWHAATCGDTDEVRDMAEHAIVWGEVTSPATCETAGVQKGSCLCGYTTTRPVEATGHDFAPSWGWNSDFSSAILTLICGNDPEHTHTVTATVSSESGADACSDYVMHTATATYDGKTYTDSKRIETESHHLYELSEWIWDGDLSGAKAKFVCQRDASHVLESERVASVETGAHEDATCTVDGYTEYKVSVQLNGQTYEGTAENGGIMRKTLTKLGHDFDTPWQYDEGQHWHKCSRCDETDAHVGHTLNGDGECATCGYTQITPVDEFDFSENGSTWRITGYNGSRTNMVIPSEYRGLPVTEIGMRAFYGCESIRKLTIPQTITGMGSDVFIGCVNIEEVTSPAIDLTSVPKDSLRKLTLTSGMRIEANAFKDYTLLAEITFPDSIRYVGKDAFANTAWLAKQSGDTYIGKVYYQYVGEMPAEYELRLRDDTAYITEYACYGQTGLASLMIPDSVTSIGAQAFAGCTGIIHLVTPVTYLPIISNVSLTDIEITKGAINADTFKNFTKITNATIGANVTSVAQNSFSECLDLESISVVPENSTYQSLTGVVYNKADKSIYIVPKGLSGEVTILDGCQRIEENTFSNYANITSITISNSIVSIGNSAFGNCVNLQTVNWNATNCTTAGSSSKPIFEGCTGLATINIGENVENIPAYAFYACTGLQTVTIGEGVTSIGNSAFKDCTGLQTVNWNATNCTSAGNYEYTIFKGCTALATVNIGENVESIPAYAFRDFTGLQTVTIPESVTSIGNSAFSGCTGLQTVTICIGVTSIGEDAFRNCTGLQTVTIGEGVTSIGEGAFYGCTSLQTVTIPNSVTSIGEWAFSNCTGLRTATIGEGVTSIENSAFRNCTGLQTVNWNATNCTTAGSDYYPIFGGCTGLATVNIGENVTSIPNYLLYNLTKLSTLNWNAKSCTRVSSDWLSNCPELTTLNIGAKVGSFYSFENCTWLQYIYVSPENNSYQSYQGIVYWKNDKSIYRVPKGIQGDITILDGCQNISGFSNCKKITSVTIPESVTSIGNSAFNGCTGITKVVVSSLKSWCEMKFGNSSANPLYGTINAQLYANGEQVDLVNLNIGDGITKISNYAFYGQYGTQTLTISDSVVSIGEYTFAYCTALKTLTIGECVTSIGDFAFANCTKLETVNWNATNCTKAGSYKSNTSDNDYTIFKGCTQIATVNIGENVESIPQYAFYNCTGITRVNYLGDLKGWCEIEFGAYNANPLYKGRAKLYVQENGEEKEVAGELNIPVGTTKIAIYAFYGLTDITSVTIPESVTSIGYYAFGGCTGLQTVTIPDSVTIIGEGTFYNCTGLRTVTIGEGVESIGDNAFSGCTYLQTVNWNATNCTTTAGITAFSIFEGCIGLATVNIGANVTNIGNMAFASCTGITRVDYLGDLKGWCEIEFGFDGNPLNDNAQLYVNGEQVDLVNLIIPEGITKIGNYAFYGLTIMTSVTIPDSVTNMGSRAFSGCTGITRVNYLGDLKGWCEIEFGNEYANPLYDADNAKLYVKENGEEKEVTGELSIPDGITKIGNYVFNGLKGITFVNIPASVTAIGSYAFSGCTGLKTVTISASVTTIGSYAFSGCTGLQTVTIGKGVTSIGYGAFSGCTGITTAAIPAIAIASIPKDNLNTVTITSGQIPGNAFRNRTGLQTVTIGEGVTSIGSYAFYNCTGLQTVNWNATNCTTGGSSYHIFDECTELTTVNIGENVESIPAYAFYGCTGITRVNYLGDLKGWCEIEFGGSYANPLYVTNSEAKLYVKENGEEKEVAGEVNIPVGTTKIGVHAFYGLTGITSVTIPDSVTSIGNYAFSGCTGLQTVTIGIGLESIGYQAFYNCKNVKDIYYVGDETQWGQITKDAYWNKYYSGSSYYTISYQMHYNSTGPEAAAVSSSEATGYEGQERIAEVRVPEAWIKQD